MRSLTTELKWDERECRPGSMLIEGGRALMYRASLMPLLTQACSRAIFTRMLQHSGFIVAKGVGGGGRVFLEAGRDSSLFHPHMCRCMGWSWLRRMGYGRGNLFASPSPVGLWA